MAKAVTSKPARDTSGRFKTPNPEPATNGGNPHVVNASDMLFADLVVNALKTRSELIDKVLDPRRNINDECGYPKTDKLTAHEYKDLYEREGVATRVVEMLPKESWKVSPSVFEDEDAESTTAFEEAWLELPKSLRGRSWYQDEEGNAVWEALLRADINSRIGSFGVLLLGVDDGKEMEEPLDGVESTAELAPGAPSERKLLFLRSFDETLVDIVQFEADPENPRFGQPVMYDITFGDPTENTESSIGQTTTNRRVHWTRVIHLAENLNSSEVFAAPAMRPSYNRLYDLRKLYGGSAEMYWRGAFFGLSIETHPQVAGEIEFDRADLRDAMENYMNGLQRYLLMPGVTAKSLAPQVVDPTAHIDAYLTAISIQQAIPKRKLMGSERGELSSGQDEGDWNDTVAQRQNGYLTPRVIVPFIDRCIAARILPVPLEGYSAVWPDLNTLSDLDAATVAVQKTEAMAKYVAGSVESIMPPMDYLTRILGMDKEEAEAILEAAEEIMEEKEAEREAMQEEVMGQLLQDGQQRARETKLADDLIDSRAQINT